MKVFGRGFLVRHVDYLDQFSLANPIRVGLHDLPDLFVDLHKRVQGDGPGDGCRHLHSSIYDGVRARPRMIFFLLRATFYFCFLARSTTFAGELPEMSELPA